MVFCFALNERKGIKMDRISGYEKRIGSSHRHTVTGAIPH